MSFAEPSDSEAFVAPYEGSAYILPGSVEGDQTFPLDDALRSHRLMPLVKFAAMEMRNFNPYREPEGKLQPIYFAEPIARGVDAKPLSGLVVFFLKLLERWQLSKPEGAALLGFGESGELLVAEQILRGDRPLEGRDLRDRIAHLLQIHKTLGSLFRDLEVENQWLREPHGILGGRSPLELMLQGSMEDLLLAKEYVDAAAGR